jgi:hypothetical protein
VHWILQNNLYNESGYDKAIEVFEEFQISYSIHKVVPFSGELIPEINPEGKVICLGSYSMRHVAKAKKWSPGVFDLEPMTFIEQMKHWGQHMLNADSVVCPFKDAVIEDVAFMRPIEDSKCFAGALFTATELIEWQKSIVHLREDFGATMNEDTMVQICSVKQIYAEYRYWIVDGQIATKSRYKLGDKVNYSNQVDQRFDEFVNALITPSGACYWSPHEAYCLDVCDTPNGIKIVEINTLNSAGFYAADMQKLILSLESYSSR